MRGVFETIIATLMFLVGCYGMYVSVESEYLFQVCISLFFMFLSLKNYITITTAHDCIVM